MALEFLNDAYFAAKVGIGTESPNEKLEVNGAVAIGNATDGIKLRLTGTVGEILGLSTTSGSWNDLDIRSQAAPQLYLKTDGNVGIGETTPLVPLHISRDSASGENIALLLDNNSTTAGNKIGLLFRSAAGSSNADFQIQGIGNSANSMDLTFLSDNQVERMRIDSAGNVGIGENNPKAPGGTAATTLTLKGTNFPQFISVASSATANSTTWRSIARNSLVYQIQTTNDAITSEQTAYEISRTSGSNSISYQRWYGGTTEAMRITSTGGISFGSTGTAYGTSGQVLTSAGNASPTWTTPTTGSVTSINTGGGLDGGPITVSGTIEVEYDAVSTNVLQSGFDYRNSTIVSGDYVMVSNPSATGTYRRIGYTKVGNLLAAGGGSGTVTGTGTAGTVTKWSTGGTGIEDGPITFSGNNSTFAGAVTLGGNLEMSTNNANFADNGKARFGSSADLQIYHDGSNSYITDTGTGDLYIRGSNSIYIGNPAGTASYISGTDGGAVNLYYNGSSKLTTTSTGVTVTGDITVTGGDITSNGLQIISNSTTASTLLIGDVTLGDTIQEMRLQVYGADLINLQDDEISLKSSTVKITGSLSTTAPATYLGLLSSTGILTKRTPAQVLSDIGGAPATGGSYLPLAGGTMTGNIVMGDNDITGIDQLTFSSGTYLTDISSNYVNLHYASSGAGGLLVANSNGTQGYLYADGATNNNSFGLLDGSGSWAVRCKEAAGVELYYSVSNGLKFETTSTGVTVTGAATATTFLGDLNGTINTVTTATTQVNAIDNDTVATTAYVNNKIALIPAGLVFQGTWNASTNTPTLTSGTGTTGNFYIVSVAGSTNLDGITDWKVGDWAVFIEQGASDQWEKIDNSSVLDGIGTGQSVTKWDGSGTSNTLTNGPITFSTNDSTFAGNAIFTNGVAFSSAASIRQQSDILILTGGGNGFAFNDDTNAVSNLLINAGGEATFSSNVTITGNALVGSGTIDNPQGWGKILQVQNSGNNGASLSVKDSNNEWNLATYNGYFYISDNVEERLIIDLNGNVGIGVAPVEKLDVYQSATGAGVADFRHVNGNRILINPSYNYYDAYNHIFRGLNGTDTHMTIDLNGKVGIGTTSPGHKLVSSITSPGYSVVGQHASGGQIGIYSSTGDNGIGTINNYALNLFTNNSAPQVTLLTSGNVGIGTTSPNQRLDVAGNVVIPYANGYFMDTVGAGASNFIKTVNSYETVVGTDRGSSGFGVFGNSNIRLGFGTDYTAAQTTLTLNTNGSIQFNAYDSTNNTGTPTYLLGTDASGNVVKTLSTPSPITSQAASLYDLIPNGAFTTTYAFTSTAGTYAEVMESNDVITASGTYSVQVYVSDYAVGGTQYTEYYSGVMTWYAASTNDNGGGAISEISLHRAGHAANSGVIYLRTRETTSPDNVLKLEIMSNKTYTGASNIVFKFVRLI